MNRVRSPKEIAFLILLAQTATGVLVAMVFSYFESIESARSSFIGSAIAVLTSLHLLSVLLDKREKKPKSIVNTLYLLEAFKFVLTALLFVVAIILLKAIFFPLIIGYSVAIFIYWLSLLITWYRNNEKIFHQQITPNAHRVIFYWKRFCSWRRRMFWANKGKRILCQWIHFSPSFTLHCRLATWDHSYRQCFLCCFYGRSFSFCFLTVF